MTPDFFPRALLGYAPALVLGAGASLVPARGNNWIGLAVLALSVPASPYLCAALPSVSFTLIALSALRLLAPGPRVRFGCAPLAAPVLAACLLYATALGWGAYDPYDLGFRARPLLAVLAVFGVVLAATGESAALALLAADLLAYAGGLYANLWDALIDPVLVLLAVTTLAARGWRLWVRGGAPAP